MLINNQVEDCRSIDIRRWKRGNWLAPGTMFHHKWSNDYEVVSSIGIYPHKSGLELKYNRDGESISYFVEYSYTACNYGGSRIWLICPMNGCDRRCAKLYSNGKYYTCRACSCLTYRSQAEDEVNRTFSRTEVLAQKIGARIEEGSVCIRKKPKGMHWKTYTRRLAELKIKSKASARQYCIAAGFPSGVYPTGPF